MKTFWKRKFSTFLEIFATASNGLTIYYWWSIVIETIQTSQVSFSQEPWLSENDGVPSCPNFPYYPCARGISKILSDASDLTSNAEPNTPPWWVQRLWKVFESINHIIEVWNIVELRFYKFFFESPLSFRSFLWTS